MTKKTNEEGASALDILVSIDRQLAELVACDFPRKLQKIEESVSELKAFPKLLKSIEDLEKYYIGAKKCLTLQEAANYLGLQRSVLYKMTSDKTIRFFKPNGKMIYFEKDVLDDWVRQNPTNPINNEDYDRK
jgi:excisionase family DNA binding protein